LAGRRPTALALAAGGRRLERRMTLGTVFEAKLAVRRSFSGADLLLVTPNTGKARWSRFPGLAEALRRGLRTAVFRFAIARRGWLGLTFATFLRRTARRGVLVDAGVAFAAIRRRGAVRFAPVPFLFRLTGATARFMNDYLLRLGRLLWSCNANSRPFPSFFALASRARSG